MVMPIPTNVGTKHAYQQTNPLKQKNRKTQWSIISLQLWSCQNEWKIYLEDNNMEDAKNHKEYSEVKCSKHWKMY